MWPNLLASLPLLSFGVSSVSATCLNDFSASKIANNFATLISAFNADFAWTVLAPDFTDQSDSVSWLISNGTMCPKALGAETFTSRENYISEQATQPDLPFSVLNVFHDCTNVFFRYRFDMQPQEVQGIGILQTELNKNPIAFLEQPYLIKNVYSEFNTGAFITDLGYYQGTNPGCTTSYKRGLGGVGMPWVA